MKTLAGLMVLVFPLTACGAPDEPPETPADEMPQVEIPASETPEDLQVVQVRVEGDAYLFSPASVRAGHPVRLVFDPDGALFQYSIDRSSGFSVVMAEDSS